MASRLIKGWFVDASRNTFGNQFAPGGIMQGLRPSEQSRRELSWIQKAEHAVKSVMRGYPVGQGERGLQPLHP